MSTAVFLKIFIIPPALSGLFGNKNMGGLRFESVLRRRP
jgi:hypothetical protein